MTGGQPEWPPLLDTNGITLDTLATGAGKFRSIRLVLEEAFKRLHECGCEDELAGAEEATLRQADEVQQLFDVLILAAHFPGKHEPRSQSGHLS